METWKQEQDTFKKRQERGRTRERTNEGREKRERERKETKRKGKSKKERTETKTEILTCLKLPPACFALPGLEPAPSMFNSQIGSNPQNGSGILSLSNPRRRSPRKKACPALRKSRARPSQWPLPAPCLGVWISEASRPTLNQINW